jgi:hypothetical protein
LSFPATAAPIPRLARVIAVNVVWLGLALGL